MGQVDFKKLGHVVTLTWILLLFRESPVRLELPGRLDTRDQRYGTELLSNTSLTGSFL